MNCNEIRECVDSAIDLLYKTQQDLFDLDVNEVTINSYLAEYLRGYFPEHKVDIEYNREHVPRLSVHGTKKTITPNGEEQNIKLDIIVHKRNHNTSNSNLLVIECKKQWNTDTDERNKDLQILGGMTMAPEDAKEIGYNGPVFAYKIGLFIDYGRTRQETVVKRIKNGTNEFYR